jgi:mRNA-binding protein PUF3
LLVWLKGEEKHALAEEIKPQFLILKRHGNSRQLQAMEKALGLGQGSSSRPEAAGQMNGNSPGPTPVLTNETNSPQSSSPPTTHASALEQASGDATANNVNGVAPQVQDAST